MRHSGSDGCTNTLLLVLSRIKLNSGASSPLNFPTVADAGDSNLSGLMHLSVQFEIITLIKI